MAARERGVSSVEILPGTDITTYLAKLSSRLDSMKIDRQGYGQCGAGGRVEPSHGLYGGGSRSISPRLEGIMVSYNIDAAGPTA